MSQIVFNTLVNLQTVTSPSTGYIVAYDLDGILKQKNSLGVITPIGIGASQSLYQSLIYGNDSGTYSINLGTSSYISSSTGNGRLYLGYGNTYSTYLVNGDLSTATSSLNLTPNFLTLSKTTTNQFNTLTLDSSTFSVSVGSSTYSTNLKIDKKTFKVSFNESYLGTGYNLIDSGNISDGNDGRVKSYLHLNTYGSTTSYGVYNSVIIGGSNLVASQSNTVYLGNNVNINNKYKLPSVDGSSNQVMATDGSGNLSWVSVADGSIPPLNKVLQSGSTSGSYSIYLGASQSIGSSNGNSSIQLDYNGNPNQIFINNSLGSYLLFDNTSLTISTPNGIVTTGNGKGLQYSSDYSPTFVTNSLVTKAYVDNKGTGSYLGYKIVYVDPNSGNNTTAQVNRIDLPYSSISAASTALSSSYTSGGLVYLKRCVYSEICQLLNNTNYYCEPGVTFVRNGFNDAGGSVTSNIYGYAQFIGTDSTLVALSISNNSNINFEFDSIDNSQVAFNFNSSGNISVKGRYIRSKSDFGSSISIQGSGNFKFDIKDTIIGGYNVIYAQNTFSGSLIVSTNKIICDSSIGTSGPQAGLGHALIVGDTSSGNVTINSDLINNSVYSGGDNSSVKIGSSSLTINGNLYGNNEIGLYLSNGNGSNVTINGNIQSSREAIKHLGNKTLLKVNNSLIKSSGLGSTTYSIHINSASQSGTYLYNTTIYNSLSNSSMIYIQGTTSQFGVYNSFAYSPGTTGNFIYGTPSFNVGIHNTRSNKDNYSAVNDIFSPSGFIYDTNLYLPIF